MIIKSSYQPDYGKHYALIQQWNPVIKPTEAHTLLDASLVLDTRLQDIADAYQATLDEAPYLSTGGILRLLRTEAPVLADLLDALTEWRRCSSHLD